MTTVHKGALTARQVLANASGFPHAGHGFLSLNASDALSTILRQIGHAPVTTPEEYVAIPDKLGDRTWTVTEWAAGTGNPGALDLAVAAMPTEFCAVMFRGLLGWMLQDPVLRWDPNVAHSMVMYLPRDADFYARYTAGLAASIAAHRAMNMREQYIVLSSDKAKEAKADLRRHLVEMADTFSASVTFAGQLIAAHYAVDACGVAHRIMRPVIGWGSGLSNYTWDGVPSMVGDQGLIADLDRRLPDEEHGTEWGTDIVCAS